QDLVPKSLIFNQGEIPGLHKSARAGVMSSREDSDHNVMGDCSGLEMPAYITSQHDGFVNCCAFLFGKNIHNRKTPAIPFLLLSALRDRIAVSIVRLQTES